MFADTPLALGLCLPVQSHVPTSMVLRRNKERGLNMMKFCARFSRRFGLLPVCATLLFLLATGSVQALTTFTAGSPARASEVNGNFTELNDRIATLEAEHAASTVNVDCGSDTSALQTAVAEVPTGATLVVTGTCTGPIMVNRNGLTLRASTAGTDGISSSGVNGAVLTVRAHQTAIDGLSLHATSAVDSDGLLLLEGYAVLTDLHVSGAEQSIIIARGGTAKMENTTRINGLYVVDGGVVRMENGNGGFKIEARRNGVVNIRDSATGSEFTEIGAFDGGRIISEGTATNLTVNGKITLMRSSSARFRGPLIVNHTPGQDEDPGISLSENATLRLHGGTINAETDILGSSSLRAFGTDFVDPTDDTKGGVIAVGLTSALFLEDGSTAGAVEVDNNSSAVINDATLSGVTRPWDLSHSFAVDIASGGQFEAEDGSTINGNVHVGAGGVFGLDEATLNGSLNAYLNGSIDVEGGAINAPRASSGTCPSGGIRLSDASIMQIYGNSTISGYLRIVSLSLLSAWEITDFGGTVDAQTDTIQALQNSFQSTTGINVCTPAS